jgi:MFS family permease
VTVEIAEGTTRQRVVGWLWASAGVSYLGDGVRLSALPLLALTVTDDPVRIGGVTVAVWLPWLLVSLHAGALVDRVDRARLLRDVQLARALVVGALVVLVLTDAVSIWAIYLTALLLGIGEVVADTAIQSLVPSVVEDRNLERTNGRLLAAEAVGNEFVGPATGGLLFAAARFVPFLFDAVSFAASAALAERLRRLVRSAAPRRPAGTSVTTDIVEGVRYLLRHPTLRSMAVWVSVLNLCFAGAQAMLVLYNARVLGQGGVGFGVLLTAGGVGGFLGAVISPMVVGRLGRAATLIGSSLLAGVATFALGLVGTAYLAVALQFVAGFCGVSFTVIGRSLRQSLSPPEMVGRVVAAYRALGFGAIPLGGLLAGLLTERFGIRSPYLVAGVLAVLATVAVLPWLAGGAIERARAEMARQEVPR